MTVTYSQLGSCGRAANQLFQISVAICHALKNNTNYIFPRWEHEQHFNLHGCFSNNIKSTKIYTEPYFHYSPIPSVGKNEVLDLVGYFQSYKFHAGYEEEIKRLLTPTYHAEREEGLCAIHWRLTDYRKFSDCHPVQTMKYYEKAMELSGCKKFLVFSDDVAHCKENFKGNMFEFSEGNHPATDLALMAKKCEHGIIGNSSFSWWGFYLNNNPNKKVIYPSNWFGPGLNHDTKDLCPPEWIKI